MSCYVGGDYVGLKAALCGRCVSSERVDNELELGTDLDDTVLYKDKKLKDQVEVAIGDGMEFTIPGIDITYVGIKKSFDHKNNSATRLQKINAT